MLTIEAKIAAIISRFEVALNKGSSHGVQVGSEVELWDTISIKDPDSGEYLGSVRTHKGTLRIIDVQDHFSLAATPKPQTHNALMAAVNISSIFASTTTSRTELRAPNMPTTNRDILDVTVGESVDIRIEYDDDVVDAEIYEEDDVTDVEIIDDDGD